MSFNTIGKISPIVLKLIKWDAMNNLLYQFYWHFIKKNKFKNSLNKFHRNIESYDTAKKFGIPKLVYIGDSNSERLDTFNISRKFNRLSVVFGFSGLKADDYVNFLRSKDGENFYCKIIVDKPIVVWNIVGNNLLQDSMNTAKPNLLILKSYFPDSYIINLPPIHIGLLKAIHPELKKSKETLENELLELNQLIGAIWGNKVIDFASEIMNPLTGEAIWGKLQDPVHYSEQTSLEIVKILNSLQE